MIMEFTKEKSKIAYYNEEGKMLAEVTFPAVNKNTVNINHTFVDESLRGQGIAGKLMQQRHSIWMRAEKKCFPHVLMLWAGLQNIRNIVIFCLTAVKNKKLKGESSKMINRIFMKLGNDIPRGGTTGSRHRYPEPYTRIF